MNLLPEKCIIAVDTEFYGPHTLTIQVTCRFGEVVRVQVYRSSAIPNLAANLDVATYFPPRDYSRFLGRCVLVPAKVITPDLSPIDFLVDLLGIGEHRRLSRVEGDESLLAYEQECQRPRNLSWDNRKQRWRVPSIEVNLVAHFWTADFMRILGRDVYAGLGDIGVQSRRRLAFAEKKSGFLDNRPVLGYLLQGHELFAIRVKTFDTALPFGPGSLDRQCHTFLGLSKYEGIGQAEKSNMLAAFHENTNDTYGYAIVDAVNTLLVYEEMEKQDHATYEAFGFADKDIPPLRPTLGGRVAEFLVRSTQQLAAGSNALSRPSSLKGLMRMSGVGLFDVAPDASKFNSQTANVHGGLLFSRSPTEFWHASSHMLRDVDMSGCYNSIISRRNVYWGRPVVFEPGAECWPLDRAMDFVNKLADADAWVIYVTGDITTVPNVLVPSTENAMTSENFNSRVRKRRQTITSFAIDYAEQSELDDDLNTRLFSRRIEFGIVTSATWSIIRALPVNIQRDYAGLRVESIVFYPRSLVAKTGEEYDALLSRYASEEVPWSSALDMQSMELVQTENIGRDYVSLKFPIGAYARRVGMFRRQAQEEKGKGSGQDLSWKVLANTMYGVLASPYLPTHNFVAANQITAAARAGAFALMLSLNGIQVITDGCTYRRDQIPNCTFEECLRIQHDYPLHRADQDSGIPFHDPTTIPTDDQGFTAWQREHVKRFFGVSGEEYDNLFSTHRMEHKETGKTGSVAFDAMGCDGCGNYVKCNEEGGSWKIEDIAARAYRQGSKAVIQGPIVQAYSTDNLTALIPIAEDHQLLKFKEATLKTRKAIESGIPEVYFPLGMEHRKVCNYKVIKASAFIFQTPEQRKTLLKQIERFQDLYGCGLELLAMRRTYGDRHHGSICDIARAIYEEINEGGHDLLKRLNMGRLSKVLREIATTRVADIEARKEAAERELFGKIDARLMCSHAKLTGYFVTEDDIVDRIYTP